MSDRSYCQLYVYACPEDQRAAALEAIDASGLGPEWGSPRAGTLQLGATYCAEEGSLDLYEIVAHAIQEAAPGAAFVTWTDPKYEYPGVGIMRTPDLGMFTYVCDSEGRPYWTAEEIDALPADPEARSRALGRPWREALDALRDALPAESVPA